MSTSGVCLLGGVRDLSGCGPGWPCLRRPRVPAKLDPQGTGEAREGNLLRELVGTAGTSAVDEQQGFQSPQRGWARCPGCGGSPVRSGYGRAGARCALSAGSGAAQGGCGWQGCSCAWQAPQAATSARGPLVLFLFLSHVGD